MKKRKIIISLLVASVLGAGVWGAPVFAVKDKACEIAEYAAQNPACNGDGDFFKTFDSVMNAVMAIVGVIATIVIIVAGVMMMTSQGDAAKVKRARSAIIYAAIGMIVTLAAWAIVNFVVDSV